MEGRISGPSLIIIRISKINAPLLFLDRFTLPYTGGRVKRISRVEGRISGPSLLIIRISKINVPLLFLDRITLPYTGGRVKRISRVERERELCS